MRLSIIVGLYNMQRELERTLLTMSANYQGVNEDDYEIILVDNGSSSRSVEAELRAIAGNVRYRFVEDAGPSPTNAINAAVQESHGELITVVIDGARMFSPGLLRRTIQAFDIFDDPFVYAPSLHLGPQLQNDSSYGGYDQSVEDALLDTVPWQTNGYSLFSISNVDAVPERLLRPTFESNCFTVQRRSWDRVGGYDRGFVDSVAGGIANWELFARYMNESNIDPVLLVGEATFHQFHGGASTNQPRAGHPIRQWLEEHRDITGKHYEWPLYEPFLFGKMRGELGSTLFERNVRARIALARELSHAAEHDAAIAIGRLLCAGHPNDPGKLQILAETLERSSRRAEALEVIDRALAIAPTQAELHVTRGVIQVGLGRLEGARASYDEAVRLDNLLAEAFFHRAHLELREQKFEHAVSDFEQAISVDVNPSEHYQLDLAAARQFLAVGPDSDVAVVRHVLDLDVLRSEFLDSVERRYAQIAEPDMIRLHSSEGSFSQDALAVLCALVTDVSPSRLLIVGGFLGLSTAALLEATAATASSIVTVDPNLRHRVFSEPLDHARSFVSSDRVQFIDAFFAERTSGGTQFDLIEFEPKVDETRAVELIDQVPVVVPSSEFDFVLIDADAGTETITVTAALGLLAATATLVITGDHARLAKVMIAAGLPAETELLPAADGTMFTVVRTSPSSPQ